MQERAVHAESQVVQLKKENRTLQVKIIYDYSYGRNDFIDSFGFRMK